MDKFWSVVWDIALISLLVAAVYVAHPEVFAAQQTMIGEGAPWYVMPLITLAPGAAAVIFTIGTVWLIRRVNRDTLKRDAIGQLNLIWLTLGFGAFWGPVMQWGLQRLVSNITGSPVFIELIVIAPVITGLASILFYEFALIPYLRKKYRHLYEILRVKHKQEYGHVGNTEPSELTRYDGAPRDYAEDPTEPNEDN